MVKNFDEQIKEWLLQFIENELYLWIYKINTSVAKTIILYLKACIKKSK